MSHHEPLICWRYDPIWSTSDLASDNNQMDFKDTQNSGRAWSELSQKPNYHDGEGGYKYGNNT